MTDSAAPPLAELTSPEQVADLADLTAMQAGSRLSSTNNVQVLEVAPLTVRARVHEPEGDVDVTLASSQSGLRTWCSCGATGTMCHHAAATALTAWQELRYGGHSHSTDG